MAPDIQAALLKLAPYAELVEPLFAQGAQGQLCSPTPLKRLAKLACVSTAGLGRLRTALHVAREAGLVEQVDEFSWRLILPADTCAALALMLKGVALYVSKVHQDVDQVAVVLSKPPEPSAFSTALAQSMRGDWGIQLTSDALERLAEGATTRFVVMTPYTDESGIGRVISLFEATAPKVRRVLIVRDASVAELVSVQEKLAGLSVEVHEFRLAKQAGQNETFHAKVVCSDDNHCYVGSSNMNTWSFNYSLELGFVVQGQAARRTAEIINAVLSVSTRKQ
jgi:hypothetical protein